MCPNPAGLSQNPATTLRQVKNGIDGLIKNAIFNPTALIPSSNRDAGRVLGGMLTGGAISRFTPNPFKRPNVDRPTPTTTPDSTSAKPVPASSPTNPIIKTTPDASGAGYMAPDGTVYIGTAHIKVQEWLCDKGLWKSLDSPGEDGWQYGVLMDDGWMGDPIK